MAWSSRLKINPLRGVDYDPNPPRRFQLESVELDPRLMNPAPAEVKKSASAPTAVKLPDEYIALDKGGGPAPILPPAPKIDSAILSETPQVEMSSAGSALPSVHSQEAPFLESKALTEGLLSEKPSVEGTAAGDWGKDVAGKRTSDSGGGPAQRGFSNLDDLLAQTGPLGPETAPILMPTDLLFDYNATELRPEGLASLGKLGQLIQRNPKAKFVIEGHTDSFGSGEYNLELSRKRAESVKAWLTANMGLPQDAISTVGYGKSRIIAPASGSIEEQQINRRVEIVIRAATP